MSDRFQPVAGTAERAAPERAAPEARQAERSVAERATPRRAAHRLLGPLFRAPCSSGGDKLPEQAVDRAPDVSSRGPRSARENESTLLTSSRAPGRPRAPRFSRFMLPGERSGSPSGRVTGLPARFVLQGRTTAEQRSSRSGRLTPQSKLSIHPERSLREEM